MREPMKHVAVGDAEALVHATGEFRLSADGHDVLIVNQAGIRQGIGYV